MDSATASLATEAESGDPRQLTRTFTAMASAVNVRVLDPGPDAELALDEVQRWFERVERECTRFDPDSSLMRANAAGRRPAVVTDACRAAIREAWSAYDETGGMFDPRVLESLTAMGYDRSLPFTGGAVRTSGSVLTHRRVRRWTPRIDDHRSTVRIGSRPIDLGGIGKGFAVREALGLLRGHGAAALVEAGGDLATFGPGPRGAEWRAAVENPFGSASPAAVLDVTDGAAATSSIRLRSWESSGRPVHHIVDPRTGEPAASGLRAVTVVGRDPARAEAWSKALFVAGRSSIRETAEHRGIGALWIDDEGRVSVSRDLLPRVMWRVSRVH